MTFPMFPRLVVELHSYCNRRCWFCARGGPYDKTHFADGKPIKKKMPPDQARRILREARSLGFRGCVSLYLYDEPFAEAEYQLDMARYAKSMGMIVRVNTNTDYLKTRPHLWKPIGTLYDGITVSLYDSEDPGKLRAAKALWQQRFGRTIDASYLKRVSDVPALEPNKRFVRVPAKGSCKWPYDKLIIAYDGSSPLCCHDIGSTFGLPNAFEASVRDLWFAPQRIEAAKALARGERGRFPLCADCPIQSTDVPRKKRSAKRIVE